MICDMENSTEPRLTFFVGLNTGLVAGDLPDQRYIDFYRRRSSARLHCAIVGNVVIPGGYGSNPSTPVISSDAVWRDVASAISARGTLPGIQLATAWQGYVGARSFRSKAATDVIDEARAMAFEIDSEQIMRLLGAIERATSLALDAGFQHIQLHAAHGYLFSLLIDQRINPRAEHFLDLIASWAIRLAGAHIATSIRISLRTGDERFDQIGTNQFLDRMSLLPFDYIDVSSGFYNIDKQLIYPGRPDVIATRRCETLALARRHPQRAFIYSGRAMMRAYEDLPTNVHLGICRDLIANPDYLSDPARGCVNSGRCHYFSRGERHVTCSQWKPDHDAS